MTTKRNHAAPKRKQAEAQLTSEELARQTEAFLKSGGKVDYIDRGISGYDPAASLRGYNPSSKQEK